MSELITVSRETALALEDNTRKMERYIMQMGQLIAAMQKRMDAMEEKQAAVTVSHDEVKRLQALIRLRADQICEKHGLDQDSRKVFRAAIKKDVLKRCGVKDLHDIPRSRMEGTERQIDSWTSIKLIMERSGAR